MSTQTVTTNPYYVKRPRAPDPLTLYDHHHCQWCDRPKGTGHEFYCRKGKGTHWNRIRRYVLARDDWTCRYCGFQLADDLIAKGAVWYLHVDHVRPRSAGGRDVPWNLVTACRTCNSSKGANICGWLSKWEADRSNYEAAWEAAWQDDFDYACYLEEYD